MKKHSIGKLVIMLVLMLAFVTGCANNGSKITIVGSSAMQLLAEQAGNDYRLSHQDSNIVVQGGGSGTGLSQVQAVQSRLEPLMFLPKHKRELMPRNFVIIKLQ